MQLPNEIKYACEHVKLAYDVEVLLKYSISSVGPELDAKSINARI